MNILSYLVLQLQEEHPVAGVRAVEGKKPPRLERLPFCSIFPNDFATVLCLMSLCRAYDQKFLSVCSFSSIF